MTELREQKNELRRIYLAKRAALSPELRRRRDARLCERFLSLVTYRYSDAVLLYAPRGDEIDVTPIAEAALAAGKTVAFPRCYSSDGGSRPSRSDPHTMTFRRVTDLAQLVPGSYDILEPPLSCPEYVPDGRPSVILVPALAYDRAGCRLGYGGGYYDRFLSEFAGTRVGLCYHDFLCDRLPRGRYDLSVQVLVTESGVLLPENDS